jgi:hypothetical protein
MKTIYEVLLERFGEPIGASEPGQGVKDEHGGNPIRGNLMKNRGFGSGLQEDVCQQCGMMPTEIDGGCCQGKLSEDDITQKAPPGKEKLVKKLKKQKDVKNPWALAWSIHNKKND